MQAVAALSQRAGLAAAPLCAWAFGALFTFVLSVAAWDFVTGLLARNAVLGWIALVLLVALAVLAALILALREWAAFLRLARLDDLRAGPRRAHAGADLPAARSVVAGAGAALRARAPTCLGPGPAGRAGGRGVGRRRACWRWPSRAAGARWTRRPRREIEAAARQVATVTALVPLALADVAMALFANLRMIRRIAEIYGGRSGSFGSLRLLRRVFASLIAAGARGADRRHDRLGRRGRRAVQGVAPVRRGRGERRADRAGRAWRRWSCAARCPSSRCRGRR